MAHRNSLPSSSSSSSSSASSSSAATSCSSSATSSIHLMASQRADGSRGAQYQFSNALLVSANGGSRVLSYCEPLSCLLASQPSPQPTLVPGKVPLSLLVHSPSPLTNLIGMALWLPFQAGA